MSSSLKVFRKHRLPCFFSLVPFMNSATFRDAYKIEQILLAIIIIVSSSSCKKKPLNTHKNRVKSMNTTNKYQFSLPVRHGAPPKVGERPPQLQFSDLGPESIRKELHNWAFSSFPNVKERDTLISVPTSRAMWLDEGIEAAHEDAFMPPSGSREFCHLHADGSFHAVVDESVEQEILEKKWGVRHMYYDRGVKEMLVYAPRDKQELRIAKMTIIESYRYASGDLSSDIPIE